MKVVKHIILSLILIGIAVGIFFAVRFFIRLKKAVIYTQQKELMVEAFLGETFPDQIKAFNSKTKQ